MPIHRWFLTLAFCWLCACPALGDERLADALLDQVLLSFPTNPVTVTGDLVVRRRRGVPLATYQFQMHADWHAQPPVITYTIFTAEGDAVSSMQFSPGAADAFAYRTGTDLAPAPLPDLSSQIAQTDMSWSDLLLQFLWWRGGTLIGEDTVRGFDAYILHVQKPPDVPGSYASVQLWIGKSNGLLLQAVGLDQQGEPIRKLWVQSVRRIEEQWMLSTMEVQQVGQNSRTRLEVQTMEQHEK